MRPGDIVKPVLHFDKRGVLSRWESVLFDHAHEVMVYNVESGDTALVVAVKRVNKGDWSSHLSLLERGSHSEVLLLLCYEHLGWDRDCDWEEAK